MIGDDGMKNLQDQHQIQTIFDLRHKSFDSLVPNTTQSSLISVISAPAVERFEDGYLEHHFEYLLVDAPAAISELYLVVCAHSVAAFRCVFEFIRDHPMCPFLVNCELGKDRTGVFIAVILLVLGVSDKDIIQDYCLSGKGARSLVPLRKKKMMSLPYMENVSVAPLALDKHFSTLPESMNMFLTGFRAIYGDADGFLKFIGFSTEDVEIIRGNLLIEV